jgi:exodeoxyribonuclease V beta subunit
MSAVAADRDFDVCGPLPSGVTVLEASAGTGKTYTIATLAARYVAEGTPLERLLLITFTRMATGELRDRVRERVVGCEQELSRILAGAPDPGVDPLVTLLATAPPEEVEWRRLRLARAVADFDAATIATTHGFCQEVLAELGTVGDLDQETAFVEDVSDLIEQALDDLYVRRFHRRETARFPRVQALQIARAAVESPMAHLEPRDEPADSTPAMRYRLARAVRAEVDQRKRRLAIMTYDDLLTRLKDALTGPNGPAARARLSARFDVVLVDEFQDTDPVQWQILDRAFAAQGVTLVLVADPKQAIYAFRGADVYAYLTAAATAQGHATLRENRRSDQPLLDAYDALFAGATLGHEGIVYREVRAVPANRTARLSGAPSGASLRIRMVRRDEPTIEPTWNGFVGAQSARAHIARDLAADVVSLLSSGARIEQRAVDGRTVGEEPLCPGHIAVLVRRNADAILVQEELHAARVPAVLGGAGSVFATPAARDWLALLEAVERPSSPVRARTAALTPFLGWAAQRIAIAREEEWDEVHRRLHRWSRILRERGVAALSEAIAAGEDLAARMLAVTGGERRLTDVRHLAELLHAAATAERLGVTALRAWLAERVADAERTDAEEERARRLESDAEAVQVLTIHRSKGLEFPIVYCPFLWDPTWIRSREPVSFHDPATGYRHTIDVGLEGRTYRRHARQHLIEQRGEDLRLAYVALTRARHQAVIWWAPSRDSCHSPLGRLLFARGDDGNISPDGGWTPADAVVEERLRELAAVAEGRIAAERSHLGLPREWSPPVGPAVELAAARFDRRLDLWWRRTSYSDITAQAHDPLVGSEPEQPVLSDEPAVAVAVVIGAGAGEVGIGAGAGEVGIGVGAGEAGIGAGVDEVGIGGGEVAPELERASLFGSAPVGVVFGAFVHRVFEAADFAAADLDAELSEHVAAAQWGRAVEVGEPAQVVAGLRAAIETPLGPLADGRRLRDIRRRDRLNELEFELPLVGGDEPTGRLTLQAIARALRIWLPRDDPMAAYAARLEDPALRSSVRGFLTGSIDLVIRLDGPRFAIADYKTNWLGPADEPLTLAHYRPEALTAEMSRAHYGLQALLYTVALHRYLRWRLPAYDPDEHLAGVLYLFVRGMAGDPDRGVFAWRPPGALVRALSDVLDGGTS